MTYNVISTGSQGNCVIINNEIAIDMGIPFKSLEPVKKDLRLVLLTHCHSDHFNPRTVAALNRERPSIRWGCCEWMVWPLLESGITPWLIDAYEIGKWYQYEGIGQIRPERLTHNVPNCGYHIELGGEKLFYATDTGTLSGVEAKDYNLYLIESNHTRKGLEERLKAKWEAGEFSYEFAAAQNHLSQEQAEDWLYQQMGPNSVYAFLHQHQEKER